MPEKSTESQEEQRCSKNRPAVIDRKSSHAVVEPCESACFAFLHCAFFFFRRPQQVIGEKWDKCHRNKPGCHQRAGHHHWKAVQEFSRGAVQHQKWKVSDYIRNRSEQ